MSYMTSYSNPEQVLKAAEELQNLNKEVSAYESLYNYMTSSRAKPWSQALEKIILLLIEISLKNKRTTTGSLSEPLRNYKISTQHNNIQSLEMVLEKYCSMSEEILEKTAKKMDYRKLLDDEDLEESDNAELYINSVSQDSISDKEELKAAWRLVWDTYRTTLDSISRHNRLEALYQRTLEKALEFCKKYNRKNEAKRLFESTHINLSNLLKYLDPTQEQQKYAFPVDLSTPETNEIQITLRLNLLHYAYHFGLWQEAIKTLEDINKIMQKSEKAIKPKILSEYFENLAKMFWKSEFYLYNAHAFFSHFSLCKSKSRLSTEELKAKSSYLILSVLSIPPIQAEQDQSDDARNKALTLLSSSSTHPSKESLVAYLMRHNIVDLCIPEVRELYFVMENFTDVVSLAKQVETILDKLSSHKELSVFRTQLENVVVYKILSVISTIYKTIRIEKLKRFLGAIPYTACENILKHVAISGFIKVRIDHSRNLITFHDKSDDLQNMTMKISSISEEVQEVMSMLESRLEAANESGIRKKLREEAELFVKNAEKNLKERQDIINVLRKGEEQKYRAEEAAASRQQQISQEQELKERKEKEKRDQDAQKKMLIERELTIVDTQKRQKLVAEIKGAKTAKINGKKISDYTEDELMGMTYEVLENVRDQLRQEEKAKEEAKLRNLFKKVDYIERAKREETLAILKTTWQGDAGAKKDTLARHKELFDLYQERKKTLLNVKQLKNSRVGEVLAQRKTAYEKDFEVFIDKVKKDFKDKILKEAKESLEENRRKIEEAEKAKQAQAEADRKRIETEAKSKTISGDLSRSTLTRSDVAGKQPIGATTTTPSGPLSRSTMGRDQQPQPTTTTASTGGISRNVGGVSKPEETKQEPANKFVSKGASGGPRFINSKEISRNEPTQSKPTTTEQPTGMIKRTIGNTDSTTSAPNKFVKSTGGDKKDESSTGTRQIGGRSIGGGDGWTQVKK
eukprot:CAMPEP_0176424382 /NCGR_PEP_ID=MMETSP0127-20121128/10808_1 /TAXON_ID=938130 /ORGANISM="Platyophrya macrostoma, Strain WH" /LENGTH=971 /DNA_ID=CAMNT_0017805437 /DNA_START=50 /DNA_END=2965 /DNA_ORIENTATION=+